MKPNVTELRVNSSYGSSSHKFISFIAFQLAISSKYLYCLHGSRCESRWFTTALRAGRETGRGAGPHQLQRRLRRSSERSVKLCSWTAQQAAADHAWPRRRFVVRPESKTFNSTRRNFIFFFWGKLWSSIRQLGV